jgi:type II secretory pathway pseudopilin PulG
MGKKSAYTIAGSGQSNCRDTSKSAFFMTKNLKGLKSEKRNSFSFFTLVEILTVVALLAFLMSLAVAGYQIAMNRAAKAETESMIKQIEVAMEAYKAKVGYYPQSHDDIALVIDTPIEGEVDFTDFIPNYQKWKKAGMLTDGKPPIGAPPGTPAYKKYSLLDSYGYPFWFKSPGYHNRGSYDLESAGPDTYFGYSDDNHSTPKTSPDEKDRYRDNISNWE